MGLPENRPDGAGGLLAPHPPILLVSTYELGRAPLGVAWPAAALRAAGFDCSALDLSLDPLDERRVRRARLVALSVPMHTALRLGVEASRRVRSLHPSARLAMFGLYAWLNREHLLREGLADFVIGGEAEAALVGLAAHVLRGDRLPDGVSTPGLDSPPALARLALPPPDRSGLPGLSRYAKLERGGERVLAGYVEATRGCKHLCRHCPVTPVYRGRFFAVEPALVLEDVGRQVEAGARHVTFGDPDFLNGPAHAMRLAEALHREWPELTFDFTAKVEHLIAHAGLLPRLARLGAIFLVSAAESTSDLVLGILRKGHTRADLVRAARLCRGAGIAPRLSWVAFTPWTTLDSYLDMLGFVADEGLVRHVDPVHYAIRLLVPPGSALLDDPEARPSFGPLDPAEFSHPWRHPDPKMDELASRVAETVESAAGGDPVEAFEAVRALALHAAGRRPLSPVGPQPPAPKLTESWFCCAEPTRSQLAAVI